MSVVWAWVIPVAQHVEDPFEDVGVEASQALQFLPLFAPVEVPRGVFLPGSLPSPVFSHLAGHGSPQREGTNPSQNSMPS